MDAVEIAKKYLKSLEENKEVKVKPIIVDCNPGVDDALALMLLSDNMGMFDVKLITSCAGPTPIDITTNNVRFFAENFFNDIKVAQGSKCALVKKHIVDPNLYNGKCGLGKYEITEQTYPVLPNAVEEIAKVLADTEEPVTIVTLGPLTNIAKVVINYPELVEKIDCIYSMIGSIDGTGNITDYSETNSYFDPEAFDIVTKCGAKLVINPLQLGNEICIQKSSFDKMPENSIGDKVVKVLADSINNTNQVCLYEINTILALVKPDFYTFSPCDINVYTTKEQGGKTVITENKNGKHLVQKAVEPKEIKNYILKALFKN